MTINTLYRELVQRSPEFPLMELNTAIVYEDEKHYLVMYAENVSGEIVHCLGNDGYPRIIKEEIL